MKRLRAIIILQLVTTGILLITNYLSYFHHQKFVGYINCIGNTSKEYYNRFHEQVELFISWILSQEYDFSFNNREVAIGIILFIFFILIISNERIRKSILNVVIMLFNKHFMRVYIEVSLYSIFMVYILYKIDFWVFKYTKDTIMWIFFTSMYLSFKVVGDKSDKKLFSKILKDSISILVILEFLLNIYTFPIVLEIVMIVVLLIISMIIAFTESSLDKEKYSQLHKIMMFINSFIGLNILIYLIIEIIKSLNTLLTLSTLKSFLLPVLFTVMFIPYLYYLLIRVCYEQLIVYTRIKNRSSRWIKLYFKFNMYIHCRFSREKIDTLRKSKKHQIINMRTKEDVDEIFS